MHHIRGISDNIIDTIVQAIMNYNELTPTRQTPRGGSNIDDPTTRNHNDEDVRGRAVYSVRGDDRTEGGISSNGGGDGGSDIGRWMLSGVGR